MNKSYTQERDNGKKTRAERQRELKKNNPKRQNDIHRDKCRRWKERCRQCKRGGQTEERVSEGDADRESETES